MGNETQLQRYKKLLQFIDERFKEDINIPEIEEACHYSYRNINRIFEALNHETIGKYIKRVRLERAAQYLRYSEASISEIAHDVGFGDVAAFSKAFKNKFNCSPSAYRSGTQLVQHINRQVASHSQETRSDVLTFEIETLPDFQLLGLEYRGAYEDITAIKKTWYQLVEYAHKKKLLTEETIYLAEILDDDEISEHIKCRYTAAIILEDSLTIDSEGFFFTRTVGSRKYAKFLHQGSHESCPDTYHLIYSHWMTDVALEMADAPVLEFYLNDEADTATPDLRTEIYIPIE
ncbi:MAG: GyrI-like domain-containing protein [Bacteroidota bacterium]